ASGFAIGVFLGGVLTDGPGWRWVFFVNVPIGLLVAVCGRRFVPAGQQEAKERYLDIPGAISGTLGLALLVLALTEADAWGWTSPLTLGCLAAAVAILTVFALIEARARVPMLRLSLLRCRSLQVANVVI